MNDDGVATLGVSRIERSFEAVMIFLTGRELAGDRALADVHTLGERIEGLSGAGMHTIVICPAELEDLSVRLPAQPNGPGHLLLCRSNASEICDVRAGRSEPIAHSFPDADDASNAARFAAAWLAQRGITGELVLIVSDAFDRDLEAAGALYVGELSRAFVVATAGERGRLPERAHRVRGGPFTLAALLDEQLQRRSERRVPSIDADPRWTISLPAARAKERVAESLGVLTNGWAGVRASIEEDGAGTAPLFLVGNTYGDDDRLVAGPNWFSLDLPVDHHHVGRRHVDLRTGLLVREVGGTGGFRSMRLLSEHEPHVMAVRAEASATVLDAGEPVRPPGDGGIFEVAAHGDVQIGWCGAGRSGIAVAAHDETTITVDDRRVVERLAAWATGARDESVAAAERHLELARDRGFDVLIAEHREAWAAKWEDALVEIGGSPEDELAARFAVFHLLGAAADTGDTAVGARGLTGDAYGGHVFWDADVYVLPALAAIDPRRARAMLEYRIRRLPAARSAARANGHVGARFPWESAGDGQDVTPRQVRGAHGEIITIATGPHEEHIVADIAWAAERYASWSGDSGFLGGAGRDLVIDTARYWASRITADAEGRGHLAGVEGPDEYHEVVDDNAYTNVMARWNLRQGAAILSAHGTTRQDHSDATEWRRLATGLVDGWSAQQGIYEQFAGYFELEPLLVSEIAVPPVAIDVLLGAARVAGSQLIKQADVLMLHHLVPEETVPGSLDACLAYYEPRTAHGSSLSPAISASLHARAGQADRALELLRMATRLDLDDLTGTTAGGLHLATMGGVWQALAYGFLGLHAERDTLVVAPCLPTAWSHLSLRFHFRGRRVSVRADHDQVAMTCDAPLTVRIGARRPARCAPPGRTFFYGAAPGEGHRR